MGEHSRLARGILVFVLVGAFSLGSPVQLHGCTPLPPPTLELVYGGLFDGLTLQDQRGAFRDIRDGRVYEWIRVGEQNWMAENLSYSARTGSWCYGDHEGNCRRYGRLYDWAAAKSACPPGWHLPSVEEWKTLTDGLGENALKKLRATRGWGRDRNGDGTSGLDVLPAGVLMTDGSFRYLGFAAMYWTRDEGRRGTAWVVYLPGYTDEATPPWSSGSLAARAASVRCVEDDGN